MVTFSKLRGVKTLSLEDYMGSEENPPSPHCWFDYLKVVPVREYQHVHSCVHILGHDWQADEQGRPFAHQRDLHGVVRLLADLLETSEVDRSKCWFSLVEQPFDFVETLYNHRGDRGYKRLVRVDRGDEPPAFVLDRDLYMHVDGARVKNVPATWTRTVSVIKLRLSGMVRGSNQLCRPALPSLAILTPFASTGTHCCTIRSPW